MKSPAKRFLLLGSIFPTIGCIVGWTAAIVPSPECLPPSKASISPTTARKPLSVHQLEPVPKANPALLRQAPEWKSLAAEGSWVALEAALCQRMAAQPVQTLNEIQRAGFGSDIWPAILAMAIERVGASQVDAVGTWLMANLAGQPELESALRRLTISAGAQEPLAAIGQLEHWVDPIAPTSNQPLLQAVVEVAGAAAIAEVDAKFSQHPQYATVVGSASAALAESRPEECLRWLQQLAQRRDASAMRECLLSAAPALIESGLGASLDQLAASVSSWTINDTDAAELARLFAVSAPTAAEEWVSSISSLQLRKELLEELSLLRRGDTLPEVSATNVEPKL